MPIRTFLSLWMAVLIALTLAGCSGAPTTVQNQAPTTTAAATVSIAFEPAPPSSVTANSTAQFSAVVSNDPNNQGVDWLLRCATIGACGSLSAPHTASGQPVTYTPPKNLLNTQTYTILAFATADRSENLRTSIAVLVSSGVSGALKGSYVLQSHGVYQNNTGNGDSGVYEFAGVVVLDGNGGVQGGEQTYTNYSIANATSFSVSDAITGGSYSVGSDGRGTLTINTNDQNIGQNGIEYFSLVVLSKSQAFIAKIPNTSLQGNLMESSNGTMDLQTSKAAPVNGFSFVVSGTDIATASPTGMGGVLNIDSPNTISGAGSISDQDLPVFSQILTGQPISGTVSSPDPFGTVKFTLSTAFSTPTMQFTGYVVDSSHIKLIETDVDSVNLLGAATAGLAVGQGAATGTFNIQTFQGSYVFGIVGEDTGLFSTSLTSAGTFVVNSDGSLNPGFNEVYFGGLVISVVDQFQAPPCTYDPTGRVDCLLTYATNGTGPEFIFYQTGNGNPPLVMDADSDLLGGAGVGVGFAYPGTQTFSFAGDYGLRFTQADPWSSAENDVTGQITVNGAAQTLAGTVDTNFQFIPTGPSPITGNFALSSTPNLLNGMLSNAWFFPSSPIAVDYYLIDASHGFFIETDLLQSGAVAFGYFGTLTPMSELSVRRDVRGR